MNQLRVGARLFAGFSVPIVFLLVLAVLGITRMSQQQEKLDMVLEISSHRLEQLYAMRDGVRFQSVALRDIALQPDISFIKTELKLYKEARRKYADAFEALLKADESLKESLVPLQAQEQKVADAAAVVIDQALSENGPAAAEAIRDQLRMAQIALVEQLEALISVQQEMAKVAVAEAASAYGSARSLMLGLTVAAAIAAILMALVTSRSITRPLENAVAVARRIARHDLTQRIDAHGGDETADLLRALAEMQEKLTGLLCNVRNSAEGVNSSSRHLSDAASRASGSTTTQLERLVASGASMQQMAVVINAVADSANRVAEAAGETTRHANAGAGKVDESVAGASRIVAVVNQSAESIADLSSTLNEIDRVSQVIRDIADQTNLLALNAAIEAARAGEQGRGFAVVADEVRKLAERTAGSIAEITRTISAIHDRTDMTVNSMAEIRQLVEQAAMATQATQEVFTEIVQAAGHVAQLAEEIADASHSQREASAEAARTLELVSELARENAGSVHAVENAAHDMAETATRLHSQVAGFKLP